MTMRISNGIKTMHAHCTLGTYTKNETEAPNEEQQAKANICRKKD